MALLLTFLLNIVPAEAALRAARAPGCDDGAGRPSRARHGGSSWTRSCPRSRTTSSGSQRAFNRMLERLEARAAALRRAGPAAPRRRSAQRVARDLHDEVNQSLTGLLLRLEALRRRTPARARRELAETKRLANRAMGELLDLARQLRPTALDDHGLVAALARLRQGDRPPRGTARRLLRPTATLGHCPPDVQLVIYRVAQEALVNAARHARREHDRGAVSSGSRRSARAARRRQRQRLRVRRGRQGPRAVGHARARAAGRRHAAIDSDPAGTRVAPGLTMPMMGLDGDSDAARRAHRCGS